MKKLILIILFYITGGHLMAQNENSSLLLQSGDGKTVKLIWFFKSWNRNITGFDIKRKNGNGDWVKLNTAPILPGVSMQKDLAVVDNDNADAARLRSKLKKQMDDGKLHEISNNDYLQKLNGDDDALHAVTMMIAVDYDMALINGFAFIDYSDKGNKDYDYGLFIQNTDKMLAQASWKHGEKPDLNIVSDAKMKQTSRKGKVQLIWKADKDKMKNYYVAGFNIFRGDKQLNKSTLMAASNTDMSEFSFFDSLSADVKDAKYTIKPITIFGIEGSGESCSYKASDFPDEYTVVSVDTVITDTKVVGNGIKIRWTFPKSQEKFIKGFYVEKDNMPSGYQKVSELLPPNTKEFIDKTPTALASYIKVRVNAVYKDENTVQGNDKLFYYLPAIAPPKPKNLVANSTITPDKKCIVNLTWDAKEKGDTITEFYQLYASDPMSGKFYLQSDIPPIKDNKVSYEIEYGQSARYQFCVSAMGKTLTESPLSDSAILISPTLVLPIPTISSIAQDSNKAVVKWDYPDIQDIKGFRVFQNNNMVVSEFESNKNIHEFRSPGLKWSANYNFTIQAVTVNGVFSVVSIPATITIFPKIKE